MNPTTSRRRSSSISGRRHSRKSSLGSNIAIGTDDDLVSNPELEHPPPPPPKPINYQEEVVFIFFNSMLETVIENWSVLETESISNDTLLDDANSDVITKDFKDLQNDELSESQIVSVKGSEVSFTKKRRRRSSSKTSSKRNRSKGSFKRDKGDKTGPYVESKTKAEGRRRSGTRRRSKRSLRDSMTKSTEMFYDDIPSDFTFDFSDLSKDGLSWTLKSEEENVRVEFKNGNVYEGPVYKKVPNGLGKFFWADGSVFEGEFKDGFVTGRGYLTLPDLSYYHGEFYKGRFHGEGVLHISKTPMIYSGQWKGGKKHGTGWLLYDAGNWYDGEWADDKKHGHGLRRYKCGTIYKGEWCCGYKKGQGCIRWKNNDFYRGEWWNDLMHGYGEYTWRSFLNETFSFPVENSYLGSWAKGKRDGIGLMHFGVESGAKLAGVWEQNLKHGAGVLVCGNGTVVERNPLFLCDKPVTVALQPQPNQEAAMNQKQIQHKNKRKRKSSSLQLFVKEINQKKKRNSNKSTKKNYRMEAIKNIKNSQDLSGSAEIIYGPINIPIHAASEQQDLRYFVNLCLQKLRKQLHNIASDTNNDCRSDCLCESMSENTEKIMLENQIRSEFETKQLRNTLIIYMPQLVKVYDQYSTLASSKPTQFKPMLIRLFLWQLWKDAKIREKGLSIVDTDLILAENQTNGFETEHDPFEKICIWQFLNAILTMAWYLYSDFIDISEAMNSGVLSNVLKKFLDEDILPNAGVFNGYCLFEFKNMIPIQSTYILYRELGEPHTARYFLKMTCVKKGFDPPCYLKEYECEGEKYREGANAVLPGAEVAFLPHDPPNVGEDPIPPIPQQDTCDLYYKTLMTFRTLGCKKIVYCLSTICPNIKSDGLIVNMDYPLSFLEFYDVLILCAYAIADKERAKEERIIYRAAMKKYLEEQALLKKVVKKKGGKKK